MTSTNINYTTPNISEAKQWNMTLSNVVTGGDGNLLTNVNDKYDDDNNDVSSNIVHHTSRTKSKDLSLQQHGRRRQRYSAPIKPTTPTTTPPMISSKMWKDKLRFACHKRMIMMMKQQQQQKCTTDNNIVSIPSINVHDEIQKVMNEELSSQCITVIPSSPSGHFHRRHHYIVNQNDTKTISNPHTPMMYNNIHNNNHRNHTDDQNVMDTSYDQNDVDDVHVGTLFHHHHNNNCENDDVYMSDDIVEPSMANISTSVPYNSKVDCGTTIITEDELYELLLELERDIEQQQTLLSNDDDYDDYFKMMQQHEINDMNDQIEQYELWEMEQQQIQQQHDTMYNNI